MNFTFSAVSPVGTTLLVLRQRMRIADVWICPPDVSLKSDLIHSGYIPGDGMASMPPMAMAAISKNAGALVVAQGARPRFLPFQVENMRRLS